MKLARMGIVLAAVVLTGCAGGKIAQVKVALPPNTITKTDTIYVKDFDSSKTVFKGEYKDQAATERQRIPRIASEAVVDYLTAKGYTAKLHTPDVSGDKLVVDGAITLVDGGSAAARFMVGMGAGSAKIKASVKVYRASAPSVLLADFEALGTSGGQGGVSGFQDWRRKNAQDLGTKVAKYLIAGKK